MLLGGEWLNLQTRKLFFKLEPLDHGLVQSHFNTPEFVCVFSTCKAVSDVSIKAAFICSLFVWFVAIVMLWFYVAINIQLLQSYSSGSPLSLDSRVCVCVCPPIRKLCGRLRVWQWLWSRAGRESELWRRWGGRWPRSESTPSVSSKNCRVRSEDKAWAASTGGQAIIHFLGFGVLPNVT